MNTFRNIALSTSALVMLSASAVAAPASYQPVASLSALAALGGASPNILHADILNVGKYDWYSASLPAAYAPQNVACPGSIDGSNYVAATGVATTSCWVAQSVILTHLGTNALASVPAGAGILPGVNGGITHAATMSSLQGMTAAQMAAAGTIWLDGYYSGNTSGEGMFIWLPAGSAGAFTPDNGVVIPPSDHTANCASGCAVRSDWNKIVTVAAFGAKNSNLTADAATNTTAFAAALAAVKVLGTPLYVEGCNYLSASCGYRLTKFDLTGATRVRINFGPSAYLVCTATSATDFCFGLNSAVNSETSTLQVTGFPTIVALAGTAYTNIVYVHGLVDSVLEFMNSGGPVTDCLTKIDRAWENWFYFWSTPNGDTNSSSNNTVLGSDNVNHNTIMCARCTAPTAGSTGIGFYAQGTVNTISVDVSNYAHGVEFGALDGSSITMYSENASVVAPGIAFDATTGTGHKITNSRINGLITGATYGVYQTGASASVIAGLDMSGLTIKFTTHPITIKGSSTTNPVFPVNSEGLSPFIEWADTSRPTYTTSAGGTYACQIVTATPATGATYDIQRCSYSHDYLTGMTTYQGLVRISSLGSPAGTGEVRITAPFASTAATNYQNYGILNMGKATLTAGYSWAQSEIDAGTSYVVIAQSANDNTKSITNMDAASLVAGTLFQFSVTYPSNGP